MRKLLQSSILVGLCLFLFSAYAQEKTYEFTYDELGRLNTVKDSVNGDRTYTYDAAGNRLNVAVASVSSASSSTSLSSFSSSSSAPIDSQNPSAPGVPVIGSITPVAATASWSAATDNVAVTGYEYSLNGGASWSHAGASLSTNLTGLSPNTSYTIQVRAFDAAGNKGLSSASPFKTLVDTVIPVVPGAPSFSNKTSTSVTATWAPSSTSGATYEWSINGGSSWTATSSTSVVVSGLTPSTDYTFYVRALYNNVRSSPSSAPFKTLDIVVSPPGTPSFSNKTITSVTATWNASSTSGATYEWSINGGSSWTATSSTSVVVSGLAPSTDYTFYVRALYNNVRSSSSSAPFKTLDIVVSPPGTPSFSNKTITSVTATWGASSTSGATYEWSINGGSSWTATSSTSVIVSGLVPSTGYTFSVRALYSNVRSGSSSAPFTTLGVEPPTSLRFTNQATTSITASWNPSPTPGATYEYSLFAGGAWYPISATSVNLTGLNPGSGYNFTVKALVSGHYSTPVSLTFTTTAIPTGAPGTPNITGITATSASATWTASSTSNATYEWTIDGWATTITNTGFPYGLTWNLSNLIPSRDYTFQVRAVKDNVKSTASTNTFRTLDVGLPGAPSFSNKTSSSVTATWAASSTSGATYEWSINGGASWNPSSSTSVSVGGLASSTAYTFSVRAIYSGVRSGLSSAPFTTLDTVVSSPGTPIFSNKTTTSVIVTWAASATSGATYEWSINGGSSWNPASSTSVTVSGLAPYTGYTFAVKALYGGVRSGASSASFTTLAVPLAMVGSLSIGPATTTSMALSWNAATGSPGPDSYEYSLTNNNPWVNVGNARTATVTGLSPNTSYTIYVRARNSLGVSAAISNSLSTMNVALAAPTGLQCSQFNAPNAWKGTWNPVPNAHHYVFRLGDNYLGSYTPNEPNGAVRISGTSTPVYTVNTATKPCKWVKACDVNNNCGPQVNF